MVYVDRMRPSIPNRHWPYKQSCHLIADTEEELHAFAKRIGLHRSWYQHKAFHLSHYDLTKYMKCKALKYGAHPITQHEFVVKIRESREKEIARRRNGTVQKESTGKT